MKIWTLSNGIKVFQVLKGRSNAYLIASKQGNILVDTGKTNHYTQLIKNINLAIGSSSLISHLILTHTHFDHCQNAKAIQAKYNCLIVVGNPESKYTKVGFTPLPNGTNSVTRHLSKIGNKIGKSKFGYPEFETNLIIDSPTKLTEHKLPLKIIPTPGHSSGSISIVIDDEIAIVGDTLFGVFKNKIFPPYADNKITLKQSMNKLLLFNCKLFLPGHGSPIKRELLEKCITPKPHI